MHRNVFYHTRNIFGSHPNREASLHCFKKKPAIIQKKQTEKKKKCLEKIWLKRKTLTIWLISVIGILLLLLLLWDGDGDDEFWDLLFLGGVGGGGLTWWILTPLQSLEFRFGESLDGKLNDFVHWAKLRTILIDIDFLFFIKLLFYFF